MMSNDLELTKDSVDTSPAVVKRTSQTNDVVHDSTVNKSLTEDTEAIQILNNNKKSNGQQSVKQAKLTKDQIFQHIVGSKSTEKNRKQLEDFKV